MKVLAPLAVLLAFSGVASAASKPAPRATPQPVPVTRTKPQPASAPSEKKRLPREGLIDHRALASEGALAGAGARAPEDDLVDLQLVVDGLYLDPVTFIPSPERRRKDAGAFARTLE